MDGWMDGCIRGKMYMAHQVVIESRVRREPTRDVRTARAGMKRRSGDGDVTINWTRRQKGDR